MVLMPSLLATNTVRLGKRCQSSLLSWAMLSTMFLFLVFVSCTYVNENKFTNRKCRRKKVLNALQRNKKTSQRHSTRDIPAGRDASRRNDKRQRETVADDSSRFCWVRFELADDRAAWMIVDTEVAQHLLQPFTGHIVCLTLLLSESFQFSSYTFSGRQHQPVYCLLVRDEGRRVSRPE